MHTVHVKTHQTWSIRADKRGASQYSQKRSLDLLSREIIWRPDIQFEALLTETANEGTGHQGHARDGEQLQQALPRDQVVEGRHLRQHDACLDTDEVVRQEAYRRGDNNRGEVPAPSCFCCCRCDVRGYTGFITRHLISPSISQASFTYSPIKTEQKKNVIGMLTMGADMLRNQFGVMGKNLRNSRKKNKQSWLSSTWKTQERTCEGTGALRRCTRLE